MFQTEELFSLKGRTAVITGGLTGLGFAITKCMVGAGAKAVVLSREKQERAEEILAEFEGRAVFYQFDITDVDRAQAMADRIIAEHPSVDSIEACLNAVLDFAGRNRRAILHIYNSVNRAIYEQYLWKVCRHVVSVYSDAVFAQSQVDAGAWEVLKGFNECECFGMVMRWMDSGMEDGMRERISRLCELRRGMVEEMVNR